MRFYLDTEFNGHGGELISLALISPEGPSFYRAKRFDHPHNPWVVENVLPVIAVEYDRPLIFKLEFRQFIVQYPEAKIIADWHGDLIHFLHLLQGPTFDSTLSYHCTLKIINTPPGEPVSEIPHNALADARALMKWYEAQPTERKSHV